MQPEAVTGKDPEHDAAPQPVTGAAGADAAAWAAMMPAGDAPVTLIRSSRGYFDLGLRDLWPYRELLFFLVWRDVKVKYKQTVIGIFWVVLQPLATMLIFTIVFGRLAKLPSNGVPYPLFVYSGLLPWQLFATGIANTTASVVSNSGLISKVYFPRLIIPTSTVISGVVDFLISMCILALMMVHYRYAPGMNVIAIPFFTLIAIATALAAGLWLSMLNVRFRDVQATIPFLTQAWLFLTPVAYSASIVPVRFRALMGINPMTSVVDGFRWAFVGGPAPWDTSFMVSLVMVGVLLLSGVIFFRRTEKTFADMI